MRRGEPLKATSNQITHGKLVMLMVVTAIISHQLTYLGYVRPIRKRLANLETAVDMILDPLAPDSVGANAR